jgi:hypothetical protein
MVDLRHHIRSKHLDHRDLIATLPHTVSTVMHAAAPVREADESLESWRQRVTDDFLARKNEALQHYHDGD